MAKRIPKGIKQREFAQKLIDQGKTRMQVVNTLVSRLGMTKGYATTMVYRWFVGEDFKVSAPKVATTSKSKTKRKVAQGATKKATSKKTGAPAKAKSGKAAEKIPSKKDLSNVRIVSEKSAKAKKASPSKSTEKAASAKAASAKKKKAAKTDDTWEFEEL